MRVSKAISFGSEDTIEGLIARREKLLKEHPDATDITVVILYEYWSEFLGFEYNREATAEELAEMGLKKKNTLEKERTRYLQLKEKFGE